MKFAFENLGAIDHGELELGDLTLICGPNSVGKTHLSHTIYGLLQYVGANIKMPIGDVLVEELIDNGAITLELSDLVGCVNGLLGDLAHQFCTKVNDFFSVPAGHFEGVKLDLMMNVEKLDWHPKFQRVLRLGRGSSLEFVRKADSSQLKVLYQADAYRLPAAAVKTAISEHMASIIVAKLIPNVFVLTSERMGIALFGQEIRLPMEFFWQSGNEDKQSKYSKPVFDNIATLRRYEELSQNHSIFHQQAKLYQPLLDTMDRLLGGKFAVVNQQVVFQPVEAQDQSDVTVPLHCASSAVKSLFLLDVYINHVAKLGDLLVIDEPELNLHPNAQHQLTALITRLVNAGIKVLVTTHSDHFICELNNRVMLSNDFANRDLIMTRVDINDDEVLTPKQLKAYSVNGHKHCIDPLGVDLYGVNLAVFEELITDSTMVGDELYYGLKDK